MGRCSPRRSGLASNRKASDQVRARALEFVRQSYADFGPPLAAEKLAERHGLRISKETLRKWMLEDDLWLDRRRRLKRAHQPRYRRDCIGELGRRESDTAIQPRRSCFHYGAKTGSLHSIIPGDR